MYLVSVVLQIILESLPISSSGHVRLLGLVTPEYIDRLAHGATVVVLLIYFHKELRSLVAEWRMRGHWLLCWMALIVVANSVTVGLFVALAEVAAVMPLWAGFFFTGCALLSTRWTVAQSDYSTQVAPSYGNMVAIGVVQGCARLPGISRLGSTYAAACWLGYSPRVAFRLSCAVQLPLFCAGFAEGVVSAWRSGALAGSLTISGAIAICCAIICAYCVLWWVERLMVQQRIWYLGWYMLLPTLVALIS